MWHELYSWLLECLESIGQDIDISIGNQPEKIKKQINKHREFHRNISLKQPMFDVTIKLGKKIIEKCDVDQIKCPLFFSLYLSISINIFRFVNFIIS